MFDPQSVLQRLGGDHQLLRTIIGAYLTEAPRLLAEARDAIAKPDWSKAGFAAHNLRGLAANVGAPEVSADAKRLEEFLDANFHADSQTTTQANRLLAELTINVTQSSAELNQFLARNP